MTRNDKEKSYMAFLALFILGGTFGLGYTLITSSIPSENRDIVNVALGTILSLSGIVVGYYFGSSKGSSDKTRFIEDDTERRLTNTENKTDVENDNV